MFACRFFEIPNKQDADLLRRTPDIKPNSPETVKTDHKLTKTSFELMECIRRNLDPGPHELLDSCSGAFDDYTRKFKP